MRNPFGQDLPKTHYHLEKKGQERAGKPAMAPQVPLWGLLRDEDKELRVYRNSPAFERHRGI